MARFVNKNWLWLTLGLLILITVLSLWPLDNMPSVAGGDKLHHYLAYLVLIIPAALTRPGIYIPTALFLAGWSGGVELVQPYVNRYREWADFGANCMGIITGIVLIRLLVCFFRQWTKTKHQD